MGSKVTAEEWKENNMRDYVNKSWKGRDVL
jgi:hypothetical protein